MADEAEAKAPRPARRPSESGDERTARKAREREKAAAWVKEKWTNNSACTVCGTNNWTITDVVEVRGFSGGALIVGGGTGIYPMFQAICSNCGHTLFFNAGIAKLVEGP